MHFIFANRRTGKTKYLLDWLQADIKNRVLIVLFEEERRRILNELKREIDIAKLNQDVVEVLLQGRCVMSIQQALLNRHSLHDKEVAIDNLDMILELLFGRVQLITTNGESERWNLTEGKVNG